MMILQTEPTTSSQILEGSLLANRSRHQKFACLCSSVRSSSVNFHKLATQSSLPHTAGLVFKLHPQSEERKRSVPFIEVAPERAHK
jgi:hypothetical protein